MPETVNQLRIRLHQAYADGDIKGVRRTSVLLMVVERECLEKILGTWNISRQTIFNWLTALMYVGLDSLKYTKPKGHPAKLTKEPKR